MKTRKERRMKKYTNEPGGVGDPPGFKIEKIHKNPWQIRKNSVKYISITKKKRGSHMEEKVKISMLCQFYGKLLTQKQCEFINDYYNNDLSLSEIAENNNITRQAVRDIIKKGEKKLFEYEEKLQFMKRTLNQEKKIEKALAELTKIQKDYSDKQIANVLETIKKELNCLV